MIGDTSTLQVGVVENGSPTVYFATYGGQRLCAVAPTGEPLALQAADKVAIGTALAGLGAPGSQVVAIAALYSTNTGAGASSTIEFTLTPVSDTVAGLCAAS